jgi:HAMP domain-containing protein
MGLRAKFNLAFLIVYLVGMIVIATVSYYMLQRNAREEVLQSAGLIMENAMAVRAYTVDEVRPLLQVQIKRDFLPQTVPAYAAMSNVARLRKKYPDYNYKEATLNPTNPSSRATEWESSIVEHFRSNANESELVGVREAATGASLYIARPIAIKSESCLVCHGQVKDAPETMLARYGSANGFGWKLNEVIGAQIVSVPMQVALDRASGTLWTFLLMVSIAMLAIVGILNLLLNKIVIVPLQQIAGVALDVSMGKLDTPEYVPQGKDEVTSLGESFNRMHRSLVNAMKMLDE